MNITQIIQQQKDFFKTQQTKDITYRKESLKKLRKEIQIRESEIIDAIYKDFKKSEFESYLTEIGFILADLDLAIKKMSSWSKPKSVIPAMLNFPSWSKIYKDPFGSVLIIAPWNYPFQLALSPLIGAVAAGNTVVLKPSELTPNTSTIITELIESSFDKNHVCSIEGDVSISQKLLEQRWDYIFFTGSVGVGKIVAKAAANNLTPTTLELGGKSPCIIDESADLKISARRMVWGKFINGGQTCIAPDYLLIHKKIKDEFIKQFQFEIDNFYGENPQQSEDYPRIVNNRNFNRLKSMLKNEDIVIGGTTDEADLYISPTVINEPSLDSEVMKDEIFGPIFPIISYETEQDLDRIINNYEKPLSFYVFSKNKSFSQKMIEMYSFGGGVINDTIVHFANHRLPFGGVGNSGMGAYHGRLSFDTFTHNKSVTRRYLWLDIPLKYAPYKGKLNTIKLFLKYFS